MLKKTFERLTSTIQAKGNLAQAPLDEFDPSSMPIIVEQSALDALADDPARLVASVIDFVNDMLTNGCYRARELPAVAMVTYHADYYLAQVMNGGHSQFVHTCGANLPQVIADVLHGLSEVAAEDYLLILRLFNEWVQSHPDEVLRETKTAQSSATRLEELDDMLLALESDGSLRALLAGWISTSSDLLVLPDAQVANARSRLCNSNPQREKRARILRVSGLERQLTVAPLSAVSLVAGAARPLAPIIRIGQVSYLEIDGQETMCVTLFTTSGRRWAALKQGEVVFYDCIEHKNPVMPANPIDATDAQVAKWKAPEIGAELARVSVAEAEAAAQSAYRIKAGAAIDLMLSQLLQPPSVDHITVRSVGPDKSGRDGMTLLLVLNKATLAMTAAITETGATLLSEPDHDKMVQVTREEIDLYADENAIKNLQGWEQAPG